MSVNVICDVDRTTFRSAASREDGVAFRLWDSASGGAQCGPDHVLLMSDLLVLKLKSDSFAGQRPRKFARIEATIGSEAEPVELCAGPETWLDVQVGTTTLTCDFSASEPQPRRLLQSVPFALRAKP